MAPAKKSSKKATKKGATKEKAKSTTKKALLKVCKLLFIEVLVSAAVEH